MQSYYYLKLRCVLRDLLIGFFLAFISISIIVGITREMMLEYRDASSNAYMAGLGVSIAMLIAGLICICLAFGFEKTVFGKKRMAEREILRQDLEEGPMAAGRNILITEHFILTLSPLSLSGCSLIRTDKLVACFEEDGPSRADGSLQLTFVDENFRSFDVLLEGEAAETGREIMQTIYERMPWIFSKGREKFHDKAATRQGRKRLLNELAHRREDALKGFAEEELELTSENLESFLKKPDQTDLYPEEDTNDEPALPDVIQAGEVSNKEDLDFINETAEEEKEIGL